MTINNSINANAAHPLSVINGGTGLSSPTATDVLICNGSSAFTQVSLANGRLLVGTTSGAPVSTPLTAGTGIAHTNGANSVIISNIQPVEAWVDITTATATMNVNGAYTASYSAGVCTLTLPATAAVGNVVQVMTGTTSGGWIIAQNGGQTIIFGTNTTSIGAPGSLASTSQGDGVVLLCTSANVTWQMLNSVGSIVVT